MQEYRGEELVNALTANDIEKLAINVSMDATSVVLGKIPGRGDEVVINNLVYVVEQSNARRGFLSLRLKGMMRRGDSRRKNHGKEAS